MPRLPTIRVIGSQDISTSFRSPLGASRFGWVAVAIGSLLPGAGSVGRGMVTGGQLGSALPPLRLPVERRVGEAAEPPDQLAVHPDEARGEDAAGGLVHEGHELVGEARHGAADADPADVRAAADPGHPAALGDVAVDDRTPAAD